MSYECGKEGTSRRERKKMYVKNQYKELERLSEVTLRRTLKVIKNNLVSFF